jgi:hypothetical protein
MTELSIDPPVEPGDRAPREKAWATINLRLAFDRTSDQLIEVSILLSLGDGGVLRISREPVDLRTTTRYSIPVDYKYITAASYRVDASASVVGSSFAVLGRSDRFWVRHVSFLGRLGESLAWWSSGIQERLRLFRAESVIERPTRGLPSAFRWGVVVLSGFLVVYVSNPTFGSPADYLGALLWGTTADVAVKVITSLLGSNEGVLGALGSLLKKP